MKKIILLAAFFTFSFSGFFISYDLSADYEISYDENYYYYAGSQDGSFDDSGLTVGYETEPKNNSAFGISYDVVGVANEGFEGPFLNTYFKYISVLSGGMYLFGTLGYNLPQGDWEDGEWDGGLSYSLGLQLANGIGISYLFNNVSREQFGGGDETAKVTRLSISYNF